MRVHSLTFAAEGGGGEMRTEKVWFFHPSDAALDGNATGRGEKKREKATDVKRGREG